MQLIVSGKRDREIGLILGVASRTVTHRIWSVCNKLGAETRAQAVAIYMKNGDKSAHLDA
jgi:DNA-binding CsgD family transcriptional regulator